MSIVNLLSKKKTIYEGQPYNLPFWNIRSNWIEYDGDSIGIVNFVAHIMTASKITNSYNMELDCYVKPSQGRANIKLTGETNITDVGYIASLLRFGHYFD